MYHIIVSQFITQMSHSLSHKYITVYHINVCITMYHIIVSHFITQMYHSVSHKYITVYHINASQCITMYQSVSLKMLYDIPFL